MKNARALLFALSSVVLFPATARAGDVFDQLWPEADVFVNLNGDSRLFFFVAGTRVRTEGYTDGQLGVHADFFVSPLFMKMRTSRHPDISRSKFFQIRLGYLYGKTPNDSPKPFLEHCPTVELTPRYYVKKLLITNRNRGDFRFIDGVFTPRYRNRLKLERSVSVFGKTFTPYAHAEAFYDWRYHNFHRFRFSAGGELEIKRWLVLEAYFMRQQDTKTDPKALNVAGVALQFYIR